MQWWNFFCYCIRYTVILSLWLGNGTLTHRAHQRSQSSKQSSQLCTFADPSISHSQAGVVTPLRLTTEARSVLMATQWTSILLCRTQQGRKKHCWTITDSQKRIVFNLLDQLLLLCKMRRTRSHFSWTSKWKPSYRHPVYETIVFESFFIDLDVQANLGQRIIINVDGKLQHHIYAKYFSCSALESRGGNRVDFSTFFSRYVLQCQTQWKTRFSIQWNA